MSKIDATQGLNSFLESKSRGRPKQSSDIMSKVVKFRYRVISIGVVVVEAEMASSRRVRRRRTLRVVRVVSTSSPMQDGNDGAVREYTDYFLNTGSCFLSARSENAGAKILRIRA